jgi:long-chain acyl-CoA synthetase
MLDFTNFTRVFDLLPIYEKLHKEDLFCLKRDGEWRKYSSEEFLDIIQDVAIGLLALKIKPGDKIAIISQHHCNKH